MVKKLNTTSLREITQFCENSNIDIKKVKIKAKIVTDLSTCEDKVELYIEYSK